MATPARDSLPAARPGAAGMWLAGGLLALANFMVVLDTAIANVSVPHIAGSLAVSPDEGTWVITSYSVAEAICVPLTGWLAARFGAVRTFVFAMAGFGLFSILCGMSVSLGMLVACRLGQGFCGGPIMPLSQTLLLRVFPPEKRGPAMGLWGSTTILAPIAGPLLGGWISDDFSWHWIFFINLPVALFCIVGSYVYLASQETEKLRQRIDVTGLVLLVVWVGSLQLMLDLGRDRDWFASGFIVGLAIVAAVGFVFFVIWELTEEQPIVDLRIFRHRGFAMAVLVLAITFGTYFAAVVVTPQWLQGSIGYTAAQAGEVTAWSGLFAIVTSQIAGRMSGRVDPRLLVFIGVAWLGFTMLLRSRWTSGGDYWSFVLPHLVQGLGMPLFFVPITIITLGSVEPRETASAAGLSNFLRTFSAAIATSIATTMWSNGAARDHADLANVVMPGQVGVQRLENMGFMPEQVRGIVNSLVTQESYVLSLDHLFRLTAILMLCAAFTIWLVPRPRRPVDTSAAH